MGTRNQDNDPVAPIALVGISCRLPGGANSVDGLWELLERGGEAWSPVPADRFNETAFWHPSADDPNGTSNHRGGHFINGDVRDFDHSFFHLSPQQAAAMDPQQRILLEMSYEALESAGWGRETYGGTSTAVYAAMFTTDFDRNLYKDTLDLPTYYITGTEKAILANRISHVLDLHGPSVSLDTGCSGGLVAMHQACQSLRDGESDAAIVAAANLTLNPDHHIGMSNMHLISGSGRSYPFDIRGDGYGRGEGFVVFVLKRLDDAIRDRDPVRAIVRSTAVNQDGYTPASITHPNGKAQAALVRSAYQRACLQPYDVAYVEAHGTGTVAGDQEELGALAEVFTGPGRSLPLYVGSIKGNIGHTENTSGLASVLKAALILERQLIPPVAGFATPKPGLPLELMHIPTQVVPFPHAEGVTPRVSVNSFGFGGANAHAILEPGARALRSDDTPSSTVSPRLFVFSANTQRSLKSMIESHYNWVEQHPEVPLADLSYTLSHRRSVLPWRVSCVAESQSSLLSGLRQSIATPPTQSSPRHADVIFVFTGQGAQWAGMGRELLLDETPSPIFRDSIRASRDILIELGATWDLEAELIKTDPQTSRLNVAELAQPATTAIQIALVALLRAQGVRPRAVVGHSSGEIAAAFTAGHLSHRTAIAVAFYRGFMASISKTKGLPAGAMMSVGLGEDEVAPYVQGLTKGVAVVACINSPSSTTISGDSDALDELAERFAAKDNSIFRRRLVVDTAYHSHHMQAVADDYRNRLSGLEFENAADSHEEIAFISSVSGVNKSSGFDVDYWTTNLVSPVRFSDAVQALARYRASNASGRYSFFVEVGPHSALAGPVRQCLSDPRIPTLEYGYQSVLQRKVDAVTSALALAGRLFDRGVKPKFDAVSDLSPGSRTAAVLHNLPAYAWDHSTKHWHESRLSREYRLRRDPYHDLLGVRITDSTSIEPRWRHMLSLTTLPWLAHHVVDGLPIFPGSGYLCMAIEAMVQLRRDRFPERSLETLALRDVSFLRGLVVPEPPQRKEVQLSLKPLAGTEFSFSFSITALSDGEWHEHCKGFVEGMLVNEKAEEELPVLVSPPVLSNSITLQADEIYQDFAAVGNVYGPTFTGIRSMALAADASEATALVEIPNIAALMPAQYQAPHLIHPSTLDILLHTGLPLVARNLGPGSVMPVHIDELLLSTTAGLPRDPGTQLNVSTKLTSSHFRTANADISVTTGGDRPVLSISAIEMRSLGQSPSAIEAAGNADDICYELDWKPDIEHLRSEDLSSDPNLTELVRHICFKSGNLSVLELGAGGGDLALTVHNAIDTYGGTLASYDFVDATSESLDETRQRLAGHSVRYRTLNSESDPASQGFEPDSYDVALASAIDSVHHASILLKSNGILVLVLKRDADSSDNSWHSVLRESPTPLDVQLTFYDDLRGSLVVVARPKKNLQLPANIHVLTHSTDLSSSSWVAALTNKLRGLGTEFSLNALNKDTIHVNAETSTDGCILVIDDQPEAILSDPSCFSAVTALLKQPGRVVWLSPDNPLSMHQITGVARTAHAENDKLRLTTIHAPADVLEGKLGHNWLLDILASSFSRSATKDGESHQEREYRVRENGTILVPRLSRSEQLNRAVGTDNPDAPETKLSHFVNDTQPLILPINSTNGDDVNPIFVYDEDALATPLADDAIEIEAQAIALSEPTVTASLGQYAGIVTRVGSAVNAFAPNDRVVATGLAVCASRPRISHTHVSHVPDEISSTAAAAMILDIMAASHALHELARLTPAKGVLIHGALSAVGRAAVATARSIGARITATAADPTEARVLTDIYGISASDILVARRSFGRRAPQDVFAAGLDAIIQASEHVAVPAEALAYLKPFGSVVVIGQSSPIVATGLLPRNAAMHVCDIVELLRAYPDLIAGLTAQAAAAFQHLPMGGLDLCTRDVSRVAEGLRLIHTGAFNQVILRAEPDSIVPVAVPLNKAANDWQNENASYVIAGGLGDLGRRLLFLMAHRGAKHLVSLSRRVVDIDDYRELQTQLQKLSPGCRLYCITCDITSDSSLRAAANLVQIGIAPVRGVIHSAAILEDRPLDSMTYDNYLAASKIKVEGTLALERAFSSPSLDFFIMLSSAVNIVGASGQANYNAGNAVQDAIAQARKDSSCHFLSLSIGWIEDAVHTADNQARLNGLRRAGLRAIRHDELQCILDYALGAAARHTRPPQAVVGFTAPSLSQATAANGNIHSAMFCHITEDSSDTSAETTSTSAAALTFPQVVASGNLELVVDFIAKAIIKQLARLISIDPALISERQGSILALGLDSLVAIELRNWVMREFDAPLQSSEVLTDQTVYVLAEKIASRSRKVSLHDKSSDDDDGKDSDATRSDLDSTEKLSHSVVTPSTPRSTITKDLPIRLPPLPLPALEDTLRLFEQSRVAVDSPEDQHAMTSAVQEFLEGPGPSLQQQLEKTSPEAIAEAYERQIYLERREPLQDYSEFSVGHPVDAPTHSQALRAAILTVAVIEFARHLAAGDYPPDMLHGEYLTGEARDWLFYATRRPAVGLDYMEKYPPNQRVVVLRRGHVFQLALPGPDVPLDLSAVHATYEEILKASEEVRASVCTLTADKRDSWAQFRHELELDTENTAALAAIDSSAFVICLDDESPSTAGERHTQFLLNGQDHPFANRWLDKPVQLAVSANGLSAGIFDHAKIDGMDVRGLHRHVTQTLFAHSSHDELNTSASTSTYPFYEHVWKPTPSILERIDQVRDACKSYGLIDHQYVNIEKLSLDFLRDHRVPPKATAHLTVLLALYLVDAVVRPAWEIVSLATFARGRLDWIQTVSPAVRAFVEAAAAIAAAGGNNDDDDDDDADSAKAQAQHARSLLGPAAAAHSSAISGAARGRGFVNHMYALLGVALSSSSSSSSSLSTTTDDNTTTTNNDENSQQQQQQQQLLPTIFRTHAWDATRRGGPDQDLKIGFMPADDLEDLSVRWDEGGFLMEGDRGVYVHCDVREYHASFAVSARPEYAASVCEGLRRAAGIVVRLLTIEAE